MDPSANDCPYAILSVPRNATLGEIKSSYRKLALRHHPDKGGDEAVFKIISAAYEILSDDARRAEHDRLQQEKAGVGGARADGRRAATSTRRSSTRTRSGSEAAGAGSGGATSVSGGRRRSRPATSAAPQPPSSDSDDAFSHPFFQQHHGFGNGSSFRGSNGSSRTPRTQFTDPFDLFESVFGEEFGVHSSMRHGHMSGGLAGHRSASAVSRSSNGSRKDPFDDPFFASSRSTMRMGSSGIGTGSMMGEMSQRMGTMHQSMMSSFHSSFGSQGHAASVGHHHSLHHGAGIGNSQSSFSSSFNMSSSSGFGGGGGFGGGQSVSTSTTTRIVNGVQEMTTERTVVHPDGRVVRSSSISTSNGPGTTALGAGNDRHRRYIDQGQR